MNIGCRMSEIDGKKDEEDVDRGKWRQGLQKCLLFILRTGLGREGRLVRKSLGSVV